MNRGMRTVRENLAAEAVTLEGEALRTVDGVSA